jgi:hypothetical protein
VQDPIGAALFEDVALFAQVAIAHILDLLEDDPADLGVDCIFVARSTGKRLAMRISARPAP